MDVFSLWFLDALPWLDQLFRSRVAKLVPTCDQFLNSPAEYLSEREVRIGPCLRVFSSAGYGFLCNAPQKLDHLKPAVTV